MGKLAKIVKPIFKPRFMAGPRKLIYKAIGSDDYLATPELQQIYLKATGEDLRKHFKDIDKPTLLLWGAKDKDTPLEIADIMNKEIKNSKLVVFENAGHFSFIDQPEKFTKELVKFIKSN
jgi:pimeloyl-ACP methyl ester carboxylesterase